MYVVFKLKTALILCDTLNIRMHNMYDYAYLYVRVCVCVCVCVCVYVYPLQVLKQWGHMSFIRRLPYNTLDNEFMRK